DQDARRRGAGRRPRRHTALVDDAHPRQGRAPPARHRPRRPVRPPRRPHTDEARARAGAAAARVRPVPGRGGGRAVEAGRRLLPDARRVQRPRLTPRPTRRPAGRGMGDTMSPMSLAALARRWAWVPVLLAGTGLYLVLLNALEDSQDPNLVPSLVFLAGAVVP